MLDNVPMLFCSGLHAETARQNWEGKKKLNIRPGVPPPPDGYNEQQALGDNIFDEE